MREALVDDALAVLAQQRLALAAQPLDLVADRLGELGELGVGLRDPLRAQLALDAAERVVGQRADRPDGIAEAEVAESLELLPSGLSALSATNERITSLAPSKIGKIRMSRRICS